MLKEMFDRLNPIKEKSPALLIGKASLLFRDNYSKEIYEVYEQEDLKEIVNTFSNNDYDKPVVISGINNIKNISALLKFLERIDFPVILLAYDDTDAITDTILSRMKTVIKIPYYSGECKMVSPREAVELWNMEQSRMELDVFYAKESPEWWYLKNRTKKYLCDTKIIDLLSREV